MVVQSWQMLIEHQTLLRKYARRLVGAMWRGSIGQYTWEDDWTNFWNLFLSPPTSSANCPICGYIGPFLQHARRPRQVCPKCHGRARHRVIHLALQRWQEKWSLDERDMLHIAPEPQIGTLLRSHARRYLTGDIQPQGCDLGLDLRCLPFPDASFDLILASHVLEHIVDDFVVLSEIYRVLQPGGVAILIVPIVVEQTIDWGYADPVRNDHVRDCGLDYFQRYQQSGFDVTLLNTDDFSEPERYALASSRDGERTIHWVAFCIK